MTVHHSPRSGLRPTAAAPPPEPARAIADLSAECRLTQRLSPAEELVMPLLAQGLTAKEIAAVLWKSPETVREQKKSALRKLGARNAAHGAALWVLRHVKQAA